MRYQATIHKNSYMIIDRQTQVAVFEFFDAAKLTQVNRSKYTVRTAYAYLCRLNENNRSACT